MTDHEWDEYEWPQPIREDMADAGDDGYHTAVIDMVSAGARWLDENDGEEPRIGEFEGVAGLTFADNEAAEEFQQAMADAVTDEDDGPTGFQIQMAGQYARLAHSNGWDALMEQQLDAMEEGD